METHDTLPSIAKKAVGQDRLSPVPGVLFQQDSQHEQDIGACYEPEFLCGYKGNVDTIRYDGKHSGGKGDQKHNRLGRFHPDHLLSRKPENRVSIGLYDTGVTHKKKTGILRIAAILDGAVLGFFPFQMIIRLDTNA